MAAADLANGSCLFETDVTEIFIRSSRLMEVRSLFSSCAAAGKVVSTTAPIHNNLLKLSTCTNTSLSPERSAASDNPCQRQDLRWEFQAPGLFRTEAKRS